VDILTIIIVGGAFAVGYTLRLAIEKELQNIIAEIKARLAAIKAKLPKL
jgi:hypothetical protein